jgi:hypothetical protein
MANGLQNIFAVFHLFELESWFLDRCDSASSHSEIPFGIQRISSQKCILFSTVLWFRPEAENLTADHFLGSENLKCFL